MNFDLKKALDIVMGLEPMSLMNPSEIEGFRMCQALAIQELGRELKAQLDMYEEYYADRAADRAADQIKF